MSEMIRIGIAGYGNLGRGVEAAIGTNPDMALVGVFTRRDPAQLTPLRAETAVFAMEELPARRDDIDVLILCGGSRSDLPEQGPRLAGLFNTVDSFDTHARIPEYFDAVDASARAANTTALISAGWDPGLFSINRLYGEALLPRGETYTFWGRGLSQGHSDAVRRVAGVADAVQYTIPSAAAMDAVRRGLRPQLTTGDKHTRECFVVLHPDADPAAVEEAIVTMPDYFADYTTVVHVITAEELAHDHSGMGHGGFVIRSGETSAATTQVIEYSLTLQSNPEFTASVLVAYARAVHRLHLQRRFGAVTVLDVAPGLLSPRSAAELRTSLL